MRSSLGLRVITIVSAVLALAGCATKQAPAMHAASVPASATAQTAILPGSEKDLQANVGDTVHFDYDRFDLSSADRDTLRRQAEWLAKYTSVRVTIQGNCDERGTRAYNIALGARRAEAVKMYLTSNGVFSGRVDTISYGKERPVCADSTDACWAQNRRAVTVVSTGAAS